MITFTDGPAAGESLNLRRTPVMLRVVRNRLTGNFDALDQLDDVPAPEEQIFVYRIDGKPTVGFIDFRDKQGRRRGEMFCNAEYRFYPDQPADEEMRTNTRWSAWCDAVQHRELAAAVAAGEGRS